MKRKTYNESTRFNTKVIRKEAVLSEVNNDSKQITQRILRINSEWN